MPSSTIFRWRVSSVFPWEILLVVRLSRIVLVQDDVFLVDKHRRYRRPLLGFGGSLGCQAWRREAWILMALVLLSSCWQTYS